jgi:AcrR family transcriptional regulator
MLGEMTARSPLLRDHIAAGILDIAASVLAERGMDASMSGIAEAAGVSRATLYRYYPSRDALVSTLKDAALAELGARVADARLDAVPADEAVARLTRAIIAAASKYRGLGVFGKSAAEASQAGQSMLAPIGALFARGITEGTFRDDLSAQTLAELYASLLEGTIQRMLDGRLGAEEASAAITSVFLTGAQATTSP